MTVQAGLCQTWLEIRKFQFSLCDSFDVSVFQCGSGGCLIELCLQLAIIMAGKQFIQNNLLEIVLP